jgi:hypothetical protein
MLLGQQGLSSCLSLSLHITNDAFQHLKRRSAQTCNCCIGMQGHAGHIRSMYKLASVRCSCQYQPCPTQSNTSHSSSGCVQSTAKTPSTE